MEIIKAKLRDSVYLAGLVLIAVSLFFFCIPFFTVLPNDTFNLFIVNYLITAAYFIILLLDGRLRKGREGLFPLFLFLILFLVSAYSLNREMTVFEESITWFSVLLTICCINYIAFAFKEVIPRWLQYVMYFMLGVGFISFVYLSVYLVSLYPFSVLGSFLLGISLHAFVPLLFCLYTIVLLKKTARGKHGYFISFYGGIGIVLVLMVAFIIQWSTITREMNSTYRHAAAVDQEGLPAWVAVARTTSRGWIAEKILKTGLVYSAPQTDADNFFWRMPNRNFGDERIHDPMVMTALLFSGRPVISEIERVKLLESLYDSRHQAQERLWSGKNLLTEHVATSVRIWPEFYLSYTEMLITVRNSARRSFGDQEEAIYTFHLPEGGVVTSLSLWINGKEEKGMLTSKEKADSAYKTIVGVENRDPSVVHWQEGNTVSVRIFPVTGQETRMFKVGITASLSRQANNLVYEHINFDGPSATHATEDITVDFERQPNGFVIPAMFFSKTSRSFTHSGKYKPGWNLQFADEGISAGSFSFDGTTYSLHPYKIQRVPASLEEIFLDINNSWTRSEFDKVYELLKDKKIFVYNNGLIRMNESNKYELFETLNTLRFSLFPLFSIKHAESSLLISKTGSVSPNLGDLQDCRFMNNLKEYMAGDNKIKLFNLGRELSPYLKSLKEYRAFSYEHGNMELLNELIKANCFARDVEDSNTIIINDAELAITRSEGTGLSVAPDHIMRIFTYNHILQNMGTRLFTDGSVNEDLVTEAKKAYIVSPVSSLVVLETKLDYDRFDIKDTGNSLKNASLQSKGAVPEPHEWMLIIIAVLAIGYVTFYSRLKPAVH